MARQRTAQSTAFSRRVQAAFGKRLQNARKESPRGRVQQDALAVALDVSRTSISNIERGQHRVFLDQVYAAARELGVSVAELLPTMEEVFPISELQTAPDAMVSAQSVLTVTDLARTIQERAVQQDHAHATGKSTRSTSRS